MVTGQTIQKYPFGKLANDIIRILWQVRVSIVVSISACHADDPGSIPGRGIFSQDAFANVAGFDIVFVFDVIY